MVSDAPIEKIVKTTWYTRQRSEVRGPFPAGLITRYILLGRLQIEDEVSQDGTKWRQIRYVMELIPDVMRGDIDDPFGKERLEAAKRWADERGEESLPLSERRSSESSKVLDHRDYRTQWKQRKKSQPRNWIAVVMVLVVLLVMVVVGFNYTPSEPLAAPDCSAAPAAGVNWRNCTLQGAQLKGFNLRGAEINSANLAGSQLSEVVLSAANLSYSNLSLSDLSAADLSQAKLVGANLRGSDLSGANLRGADLSYANLTEAKLDGAHLQDAHLDQAIWIDGRICATGSVGRCQ